MSRGSGAAAARRLRSGAGGDRARPKNHEKSENHEKNENHEKGKKRKSRKILNLALFLDARGLGKPWGSQKFSPLCMDWGTCA